MRYYMDTEFNGFGGRLISLALVPADPTNESFYEAIHSMEINEKVDPWVAQHVMPHIGIETGSFRQAADRLARYLMSREGEIIIVADWPSDFVHLMEMLITGPGTMHGIPDFKMEFMRLPGFNTADHSKTPHNALADAEALRDYCEGLLKTA
jgi:hypothetical protein